MRIMYPWLLQTVVSTSSTIKTLISALSSIISSKCKLFSPWYSWFFFQLALNTNHSLTHLITLCRIIFKICTIPFKVVHFKVCSILIWNNNYSVVKELLFSLYGKGVVNVFNSLKIYLLRLSFLTIKYQYFFSNVMKEN